MPLLDHFHAPLSKQRHWEGFHSKWAGAIVDSLNSELPPRYFAEPNIHLGSQVEVDIATFEEAITTAAENASAVTAVWSAAPPTQTLRLPVGSLDVFEIQVINSEAGPRLVAAIELVSPANKDRPAARHAFALKCAAYLQQGVSVTVVDVVTSRSANLHRELCEVLQVATGRGDETPELYATAYRTRVTADACALEVWYHPLGIGQELPTLPTWISPVDAVPLDLAESYTAACRTLRIES